MDKPNKSYRGLKAVTIFVRAVGIILLLLTLTAGIILGFGLFQSRGDFGKAQFLGHRALIMDGENMLPTINPNALVFVKVDNFKIKKKDVIAYAPTPDDAHVLSTVLLIDEEYTVCQDNQRADQQQIVFEIQVLGVVPGDFGIFPAPIGILNWTAPIISDIRLQDSSDSINATGQSINWKGAAKWGGIILGPVLAFAVLWFTLELALHTRKKKAALPVEPEDIYSSSPPPPLPPEQAPILKEAIDGQPVAVFPPQAQPLPTLGMPDDNVKAPIAVASTAPSTEFVKPQATFPVTLPRRTDTPLAANDALAPPPPTTARERPIDTQTEQPLPIPDPPTDHVATDEEFAAMLRQFEQDFL